MVFIKGHAGYWKNKQLPDAMKTKLSYARKGKSADWLVGKKHSIEHNVKISVSTKGSNNGMYGKTHTQSARQLMSANQLGRVSAMKGRRHTSAAIQKMREAQLGHTQYTKYRYTKIELIAERILNMYNIEYIKQHPLCKIARVDFYLPKYNTVIECDGCYWHGCPIHFPTANQAKQLRDNNINTVLTQNGYALHRMWEHDIHSSNGECVHDIIKIILTSYDNR